MDNNTINNDIKSHETMNLEEMSRFLGVSSKKIQNMASCGALPGDVIDDQWRFERTMVDNLLFSKMESSEHKDLVEVVCLKQGQLVPMPKLVCEERIITNLPSGSTDKRAVLAPLVDTLVQTEIIDDGERFLEQLIEREKTSSTALGTHFAIPHRLDHENDDVSQPAISLGICPDGVDFDAVDGKLTYLFILICAPTTASYLRLLAKILLMLRMPGIIDDFRTCETKNDVREILLRAHVDLSIRF